MNFGIQYNYFIYVQNVQNVSWTSQRFSNLLPPDERRRNGFCVFAGFNYAVYFLQLEFWPTSYVNSNYMTQVEGANIQPYSHINIFTGFFLKTGINVPLTRWITTRNWAAEQIRRRLKGNR